MRPHRGSEEGGHVDLRQAQRRGVRCHQLKTSPSISHPQAHRARLLVRSSRHGAINDFEHQHATQSRCEGVACRPLVPYLKAVVPPSYKSARNNVRTIEHFERSSFRSPNIVRSRQVQYAMADRERERADRSQRNAAERTIAEQAEDGLHLANRT